MDKRSKYKYRSQGIFLGIIFWELLFWILVYQLLSVFGLFVGDNAGERIVFLKMEFAWFLLIVPLLIAVHLYIVYSRNKVVKELGTDQLLASFLSPVSSLKLFIRYFLIRNSLVFAILALMQPAFGNKKVQATTNGVELIFAVDISNSMNTMDMDNGDSRLMAAKRAMNQFINQAPAAKVGMLVFAGSVYPQLPLTGDKAAAKMHVDELSTSFISNQGTNISAAISESSVFFSTDKNAKVLVLITDGENHEGGIDSAIQQLKEKKIQLLTLGIGSGKGGLVPENEGISGKYMRDEMGRTVISKLNTDMIQSISSKANGGYFISDEAFPNINPLLTEINSSEATNEVDLEFEVKENRYQWPLVLALVCILIWWLWEAIPNFNKAEE